ncbi:hypothetical protein [Marinobacter sp. F3R08]|uniref:hypothetical protein n=1 Tax=Marinobacter sp. F3R08 TaxID=2841559 RepID=UPI001C0A2363|nr:hypothetical protein [Marinobacter sp. F3R08]MBU2953028.1 hypothetical protein [Marinobacter sp. F3R08]
MKRLLIGSLIGACLLASAPAMAHDKDRHAPGVKKHHYENHGHKHTRHTHSHRVVKRHYHPSGSYRIILGHRDRLPPEVRIGRIIYDTHVLIGSSRH